MTSTQRRRLDLWLRLDGGMAAIAAAEGVVTRTVQATLRAIPRTELAAEGLTGADIAAIHGVSHQAVYAWARRHGIELTRRRRQVPPQGRRREGWQDERRRMLAEGATHEEVAAAQGVAADTIRRWVQRQPGL